jgi:ubiquinone/menaquinone biosynthesis C-methylase UbiE
MSERFIPALRFHALTPLFDVVVATVVRESGLKRRVLEHAGLRAGEHVLDVGCGTGTLAIAAARATPGGRVVGLDADPAILRRARAKAQRAGVEVAFDEALADELPYPDASFDVVLSTLLFHHLPDDAKRAAAGEIARVLRPGGRVVVGDMGRPHGPAMRAAVRGTVQLLDGVATTALNVRGGLPGVLAGAGVEDVAVAERLRTPTGTVEVLTGRAPVGARPVVASS